MLPHMLFLEKFWMWINLKFYLVNVQLIFPFFRIDILQKSNLYYNITNKNYTWSNMETHVNRPTWKADSHPTRLFWIVYNTNQQLQCHQHLNQCVLHTRAQGCSLFCVLFVEFHVIETGGINAKKSANPHMILQDAQ